MFLESNYVSAMMQRAIELSRIGLEYGGPFGAVVVRGGEIIGEGFNTVVPTKNPVAHAEINAIQDACRFLRTHDLTGCELYSSCEPCPMCWGAIQWANIGRVYFAADREDATNVGFKDARIEDGPCVLTTSTLDVDSADVMAARKVLEDWKSKTDAVGY